MKKFRLSLGVLFGLLLTIIPTSLFASSPPDAVLLHAVTAPQHAETAPPITSGASCQTFEETGYTVCDDENANFLAAFSTHGLQNVGYPVSNRFVRDGFITQAFQKAIFQWRADTQRVAFVNIFDELHDRGSDNTLLSTRQVPNQLPAGWDGDVDFNTVIQKRQALLTRPALRDAYFAVSDPLTFFGLPTSEVQDMDNHYAIRLQRAVLQEWKEDVPWASAGQVTIANGGDMAKELGHLPDFALNKEHGNMTLAGTKWLFSSGQVDGNRFSPFANQPVTLNFDADRINGNGSCNDFTSSYRVDGSSLTVGVIAATKKLCESGIMDLETQFFNALQSANGFTYNSDHLTLSLPNGELRFTTNMPVEKTIFVGAEQVDCQAGAGGPRKCLQIRESPNAEWEAFYDQIAGFEWQEGTEYELRVRVIPVENPPADASSLRYELIEIVKPTSVTGGEGSMTLAGTTWQLSWGEVDGERFSPFANQPITLNFDADQINGNGSCNDFFSSYSIDGNNLTVGPIGATAKACGSELMDVEQKFGGALESANGFSYHIDTLKLSLPNGELHFTTNMPVEKTILVGAQQVDCQAGAGAPRKCLLIRDDPNAEWETFYGQIAGFEWLEGMEYELRVRIRPIENVPADASSLRYELIEILTQTPLG